MKVPFLPFLIFLAFYSCQETTKNPTSKLKIEEPKSEFDQEKEIALILKVIDGETNCFIERNYDCWKSHWMQEEYACLTYNNEDGTYKSELGWNKINKYVGTLIKTKPIKGGVPNYPVTNRKDMEVKFFGEKAAYLTWEQSQANQNEFIVNSQETRVMEKINGKWKIVNASIFWDYKNMAWIKNISKDDQKSLLPLYEL